MISDLSRKTKRKLTIEIIDRINKNNFTKLDFDNLSKNEEVVIQKTNLKNRNDDSVLKKEIVNQIYLHPEKNLIVVNEIDFSENYLIYISKVENVFIDEKPNEYEKYLTLTKNKIARDLYNTYDAYLGKNYEIEINYQAVDTVKNYFN